MDQVGVYMTLEELGLPDQPLRAIIGALSRLPFEPTMLVLATLQRLREFAGDTKEQQLAFAKIVFVATPALIPAMERFLNSHERAVVIFEQQLMAMQRLAVLHCKPGDFRAPITAEDEVAFLVALLATPVAVVDRGIPRFQTIQPTDRLGLLEIMFSMATFSRSEWLGGSIARAYFVFGVLAKTQEARDHPCYCDLHAWLWEEYGITLEDLLLGGLGLAGAAGVFDEADSFRLISGDYLSPLGDAGTATVAALCADRDWYRTQIYPTQSRAAHAARNGLPFLQRPYLRRSDGSLLALSPRAAGNVVGHDGIHFRFQDIARSRGRSREYLIYSGWLYEQYIHWLAAKAHERTPLKSVYASGCVRRETTYRGRNGEVKTPDVVIDYGLDLVLIEATHGRFTIDSVINADSGQILRDLDKTTTDKVRQLHNRIDDFLANRVSLDDLEMNTVERIWPLLVSPRALPQNEVVWSVIDRALVGALDQPRVQPLTLLDTADYEWLMGQAAAGASVVEILRRKTAPLWRRRDLRNWFAGAPHRLGVEAPTLMTDLLSEAFGALEVRFRALDLG